MIKPTDVKIIANISLTAPKLPMPTIIIKVVSDHLISLTLALILSATLKIKLL
jgi:hypothetical protein